MCLSNETYNESNETYNVPKETNNMSKQAWQYACVLVEGGGVEFVDKLASSFQKVTVVRDQQQASGFVNKFL